MASDDLPTPDCPTRMLGCCFEQGRQGRDARRALAGSCQHRVTQFAVFVEAAQRTVAATVPPQPGIRPCSARGSGRIPRLCTATRYRSTRSRLGSGVGATTINTWSRLAAIGLLPPARPGPHELVAARLDCRDDRGLVFGLSDFDPVAAQWPADRAPEQAVESLAARQFDHAVTAMGNQHQTAVCSRAVLRPGPQWIVHESCGLLYPCRSWTTHCKTDWSGWTWK